MRESPLPVCLSVPMMSHNMAGSTPQAGTAEREVAWYDHGWAIQAAGYSGRERTAEKGWADRSGQAGQTSENRL